jgi:hypothetical protein
MTNSSKTPNFIDSRSAGLARVRLRVPKTTLNPHRSVLTREKLSHRSPTLSHWHSIFIPNAVLGHLAHNTVPIVEAARRLRGLVQPVLSPR